MNEEALNQVEEENQEIEEAEIVEVETEVSDEDSQEEESTEEKIEDEHAQYSEKVQKRINTLTRKLREAERGQESAYEYAKKLRDENQGLKQKATSADQSYLSEAENRLKSQKTQAMSILSQAHAEQDFDKVAKAQDILAKIAVEESKISTNKQQLETQRQVQEDDGFDQVFSQAQPQYTPPPPSQKAEAWAQKNTWFGEDEEMTSETLKIHQDIILGNKAEPESDEYYSLLDQGVRDAFPEKFYDGGNVQSKPSQKVASATRADAKVSGKRNVKLSPSEVQMAKRLNVPLTEYAKYVKR